MKILKSKCKKKKKIVIYLLKKLLIFLRGKNLKAHKVRVDKSNIFRIISKALYDEEKRYKITKKQLEIYKEENPFLFQDFDIELLNPKFCKTTASSEITENIIRAFEIFTKVYRINFILISSILLFPKFSYLNEEYKYALLILYENYEFKLLSTENLIRIEKKSDKFFFSVPDNESIESSFDEENQIIKMTNENKKNESLNFGIPLKGEKNLKKRVIYKCNKSEIKSKGQNLAELSLPQIPNTMNLIHSLPPIPNTTNLVHLLPQIPNTTNLVHSLPQVPSTVNPAYSLPQEQLNLLITIGNAMNILLTKLTDPLQTGRKNMLISKTDCLTTLNNEILSFCKD